MFFKPKNGDATLGPAAAPAPSAQFQPSMASMSLASQLAPAAPATTAPASPAAPLSRAASDARKDSGQAFLKIVSMLMRTPATRGLTLADLDWLVMPALRNHQAVIAEARDKDGAVAGPIGMVLWATVSPAVDARLSSDFAPIPRLAPDDWKSGDIAWVVAAIGPPEVVKTMVEQALTNVVPGGRIKVRTVTPEGAIVIKEVKKQSQSA